MSELYRKYIEERQKIVADATRTTTTTTTDTTTINDFINLHFQESKKAPTPTKKVIVRNEGRGYDSKDGKYYIYTTTRKDILGRPIEY